jgi:hypothetical protein
MSYFVLRGILLVAAMFLASRRCLADHGADTAGKPIMPRQELQFVETHARITHALSHSVHAVKPNRACGGGGGGDSRMHAASPLGSEAADRNFIPDACHAWPQLRHTWRKGSIVYSPMHAHQTRSECPVVHSSTVPCMAVKQCPNALLCICHKTNCMLLTPGDDCGLPGT